MSNINTQITNLNKQIANLTKKINNMNYALNTTNYWPGKHKLEQNSNSAKFSRTVLTGKRNKAKANRNAQQMV